MSEKKIMRILLIAISVLLILFFGLGVYFLLVGAVGSGFLGIGIAVLGLGLLLLLGNHVLFTIKLPQKAKPEAPSYNGDVVVIFDNNTPKEGSVTLYSDRVIICVPEQEDKIFMRDGVTIIQEGRQVHVDDYVLQFVSAIKATAFMSLLK